MWLFWNRTFVLFLIEVKANSFDFRVPNTCRKFEFFPFHISRHDSKLQKTESNILIYEYKTWFLIFFFFINMSVINNHIHSHFIILSTCLELNCTIKQLFKSKHWAENCPNFIDKIFQSFWISYIMFKSLCHPFYS